MSHSEFDVIQQYFTFPSNRKDVDTAVGDDCAVLSVPAGKKLLVSTDTLISDVHFPANTSAEDIAYKALMVNLSDLAAMGASPAWLTLAITLPKIDDVWLSAFSNQLSILLGEFNISLIGGDTTKGDLSITIQVMGLCDKEKIMCRNQAKPGDKIFVTGCLGDAAIGLESVIANSEDDKLLPCINKLNRPEARVRFAEDLAEYSTCAIDISDGLVADLGHVLSASHCGASVNISNIPLSSAAKYYFNHYHKNIIDWSMVLTKGDDYELCFTVSSEHERLVCQLAEKHQLDINCIGDVTNSNELTFVTEKNEIINFEDSGFKHF